MSPTLIGNGGHARDIWATLPTSEHWTQVAHHDDLTDRHGRILIGINDPQLRATVASLLRVDDETWVHPTAIIGPDCELGVGVHVNYLASMTRTKVGHHTTISPGATICGDVVIGARCMIGANATIINLTTVPDDTLVKAGSVWTAR